MRLTITGITFYAGARDAAFGRAERLYRLLGAGLLTIRTRFRWIIVPLAAPAVILTITFVPGAAWDAA